MNPSSLGAVCTLSSPVARVALLVDAAKRLVCDAAGAFDPPADLVDELAVASNLHTASVRWALEHSLEWNADAAMCEALVANAGPRHVGGPLLVVLSANVTTGALRALACAVARSSNVLVYPSSRDTAFASRLVHHAAFSGLRLVESRDDLPWSDPSARVVLYASEATADEVRKRATGPVEVHGPGLGLALLTDDDDVDAMGRLAIDVAAFDQRGCLSPRFALHVGSPEHGERLGHALFEKLSALAVVRPRGTLDEGDRHAHALYIQTARLLGRVWTGPGATVVHVAEAASLVPAPVGRVLPIHTVSSWAEAERILAPLAPLVSAVGAASEAVRTGFLRDHLLRRSDLGFMQRPTFDGSVDQRPHGPERLDSR